MMHRIDCRTGLRLAGESSMAVLALAIISTSAFAQTTASAATPPVETAAADTGEQLLDITVTARRKAETLQNVPLTVTALSAENILNKGIRDVGDVAKYTPGLFVDKGFVQQDVRPSIRGLPSTRGRPPVGILLDGIDISTESIATAGGGNLANLKLVDLERIEIVKGPQSALYGRVAFGGAINYISKDPSSKGLEGYLSGEVGSYGLYETRAAINVPLTGNLAIRVNGLYSDFDGFYINQVTGKRIGGNRSEGGAIAAKWEPSDGFKFIARTSYSDDSYEPRAEYYIGGAPEVRQRETVALPASVAGQQVGIIGAPQTTLGSVAFFAKRGLLGKGIGTVNLSTDPATGLDFPGTHTKTSLSSLRSQIGLFSDVELSTWTGYTDSRQTSIQDTDFFGRKLTTITQSGTTGLAEVPAGNIATGLFFFDAATHTRQFSQELRIGQQGNHRFRWAIGGLYWWENVQQKLGSISNAGFNVPGVTPATAVNIYYDVKLLGGRGPAQDQRRITHHYSAYATAEFDITDKLTLSVEGREARENYDYLFAKSVAISTTAVNGVYPFFLTGSAFNASTATTYFAPRATATYKFDSNLLAYFSFAKGIKPAGLSQVQTPNPQDAAFGTEKLYNYELGFKSTLFNRRLQFNAAIFREDYKDKQESTLVPVPFSVNPQGNVSLIQNIGGARIDGAELEIAAVLARGLNLSFGYTYLDARYTDFNIPQTSPITIALAGGCTIKTVGNFKGCYVNLDGNRLEGAARHSFVTSLNYRRSLVRDWSLLADGDVQYRSRRFQDNTNQYYYSPHANVNLQLGIENSKYTILFYVNNVFDNESVQSAQSSGDTQALPPGGLSLATFAADKRQFGLRARVNF
jgi:iron complex outermembrane receptor protein